MAHLLHRAAACAGTTACANEMNIKDLKNLGHWPTLLTAFLYFDFSFMVWTLLGPLGRADRGSAGSVRSPERV